MKFDIDTIDDDLLSAKETKIEDLEKQKADLEVRMMEALKDKDFHLTNEKKLDEKVKTF